MSTSSSVSSSTVVYFITGGNRGIGYGLTELLAQRPNTLVYATARDPAKADKLQQLAKQHSNVRTVQLDVTSDADHAAAAKRAEAEAGRVDVLIANAGICNGDAWDPTETLSTHKLREHFDVNTLGPVRLFTSFFPLLGRSLLPKFIVLSTTAGSIGYQHNYPPLHVPSYGTSKAAVNFLTLRIHIEHPNIIALPVTPGWTRTDMGNDGAVKYGLKEAPDTIEQSVRGLLKMVDEATREKHSGRFWNASNADDIQELPW